MRAIGVILAGGNNEGRMGVLQSGKSVIVEEVNL